MDICGTSHRCKMTAPNISELASALSIGDRLTSIYYGGAFHACDNQLDVIHPATGGLLCRSGAAGPGDVAAAVAAAKACFDAGGWSSLTGAERAVWLRRMAAAVEAKKESLGRVEAINVGRPIFEMEGDLGDTGTFLECPHGRWSY